MFGRETPSPSELREQLHLFFQPISEQDPVGLPTNNCPYARRFHNEHLRAMKSKSWDAESEGCDLLLERSKDLMIAAKLGHLWLMHHGIAGLHLALDLLAGLCKAFSTQLQPSDPTNPESVHLLIKTLTWAADRYALTLLEDTPLLGGRSAFDEPMTLSNWTLMHKQATEGDYREHRVEYAQRLVAQYQAAVEALSDSQIVQSIESLRNVSLSLQALTSVSLEHLPGEQPKLQALRNALDTVSGFYQALLDKRTAVATALSARSLENNRHP